MGLSLITTGTMNRIDILLEKLDRVLANTTADPREARDITEAIKNLIEATNAS